MTRPFTQPEIEQLKWITDSYPEDFENVLVTLKGYDEVEKAARYNGKWFLINDFIPKMKGDDGSVKVIAWQPLPEIYKP